MTVGSAQLSTLPSPGIEIGSGFEYGLTFASALGAATRQTTTPRTIPTRRRRTERNDIDSPSLPRDGCNEVIPRVPLRPNLPRDGSRRSPRRVLAEAVDDGRVHAR